MTIRKRRFTSAHPKYEEIKNFCKQQYITPTAKGNYLSVKKIQGIALEKFGIEVADSTLRFWKDKDIKKWDDLRLLAKVTATTPSKSINISQEEKLMKNVSDQIADIYRKTNMLSLGAFSVIADAIKTKQLSLKEAIRLFKDCQDVKMKLLGVEEKHQVEVVDDRIERFRNMSQEQRDGYKKFLVSKLLGEDDDEQLDKSLFSETAKDLGIKNN